MTEPSFLTLDEILGIHADQLRLYGGRPGCIGLVRLMRAVVAQLAVTGTIAVGETVIQQVVGQGLAARLSARLGEGVVNGMLTARIGLSAMDVSRPLPFLAGKRPKLTDLTADIVSWNRARAEKEQAEPVSRNAP